MSALRRMRATETPIAFKPWVYEIAKNACIDAFRRSKRAEEISYDADDGMAQRLHLVSQGPTPEAAVDTAHVARPPARRLRRALRGPPPDPRHARARGPELPPDRRALGMSRPSVESTLFRARRRLTEEYEELVSGERCRRIQAIIAGAAGGRAGARDERKMARHVSYCQPCRRAALAAGFDADRARPEAHRAREDRRAAAAARVPQAPHRRPRRPRRRAATSAGGHGATLAQLSTAAAQLRRSRRCTAGARPRPRRPPSPSPASAPAWRPTSAGVLGGTARRARRAGVRQRRRPRRAATR